MSELKPCPCDLSLLNDRILNLGSGLATMPEGGTMQVNKAFLAAILSYMEELLCMRRAQPANAPLTLEELRGMDGEPVWLETGEVPIGEQIFGCWEILEQSTATPVLAFWFTRRKAGLTNINYGKTWLAYRHKPEKEK